MNSTITLTDTIVAGNSASTSPDLSGTAALASKNNLVGGNPLLAPLGDYGGPTQTMALLPGSPALGAGVAVNGVTIDQRGLPLDSNGSDIGAFQSQGFALMAVTGGTPQNAQLGARFANPLAVSVVANDPLEPVAGGVISFTATPGAGGASAILSGTTANIGANARAQVMATANLQLGAYTVMASVKSASAPIDFSLRNLATPTIALTASTTSAVFGQTVTFVAAVTSVGTPGGTVSFFDGSTPLGTIALDGSGKAALTISNLGIGSHSITATYSGDANLTTASSAALTESVARAAPKSSLYRTPRSRKRNWSRSR